MPSYLLEHYHDIYRSAGWDCRCPFYQEQQEQRPRELSPYKWTDKRQVIILDSADLIFLKNNGHLIFIDSARLKKKKIIP